MQFDTTLKEIFQTPPTRLLEQLCGSEVVELLNIEQPSVKMRRADLVVRLKNGRILHVELQSEDEEEMPWRMLEYYPPIRRIYGQAPIQIVLYVGAKPLKVAPKIEEERLHYSYDAIDSRQLDAGPLLESDLVSDNLMALLCDVDDIRVMSRRILKKFAKLSSKKAKDAAVKLIILSKLRRAENVVIEEVRKVMPMTREDLLSYPFFSELILDGEVIAEKRGKEIGKKEQAAAMLSRLLRYRFGKLPAWSKRKIAVADMKTLDQWALRVLDAETLEEALNETKQKDQ
ncbi:MAG: hypothetical protein ABI977_01570 [Acidobacteriota bacterium]